MKRQLKVVFIILTSVCLALNMFNFTLTPDLFTRINEYEVEPWFSTDSYATNVFIPVAVEIWNPSLFPVVIHTGNWDLLDPGEKVIFENQSLTYATSNLELPATNTHKIKPGISHLNYSFWFHIYGINVTSLPFGTYEIWTKIGAVFNTVKYLKFYIISNSSGYFFNADKLPKDWGRFRFFASDWPFLIFSMSLVPVVSLSYVIIRRFLTKRM